MPFIIARPNWFLIKGLVAKYLTGAALRAEIHECKKTYCSFQEDWHADFDLIIREGEAIDVDAIAAMAVKLKKPVEEIVVRLMTHDHIPIDPERKRASKRTGLKHSEVPFPPFKHFVLRSGELTEVCRSHWEGGLHNGHFTATKGRISNRLGQMFTLMVTRIATKPNFRGYSYRDEMEAHSICELCKVGLQFDESKSNNAFAYYTTTINNHFTKILNAEKKSQRIRDDLLESMGYTPSNTRQNDNYSSA